jgi:hypothetical protein
LDNTLYFFTSGRYEFHKWVFQPKNYSLHAFFYSSISLLLFLFFFFFSLQLKLNFFSFFKFLLQQGLWYLLG